MSPAHPIQAPPPRVVAAARRAAMLLGLEIRDERIRRGWTQARLAQAAGVSSSMLHGMEAGHAASLEGYARLADALGLRTRFTLLPNDQRTTPRDADLVHAALGELEATHLRQFGFEVRLDEPYQHFQFAGRADLVAIDRERPALLQIENRTRFPDIQSFLGSYNAKRAYLPDELATRLELRAFTSVAHVVVALWSSEVLHTLRSRGSTFRSACPDPGEAFAAWWDGRAPDRGTTSTLVVLDPAAHGRQRSWVDLGRALAARPRHRGYAAAAAALRSGG